MKRLNDEKLFLIPYILQIIKDLENTREKYWGFAYVRTIRNILIGKENAAIAPNFSDKNYYGIIDHLRLDELEFIMDTMVGWHLIDIVYTNHGKLYCSEEKPY